MKINALRALAVAAAALPGLLLASGAQAHAHIVKSTPAAEATGSAPKTIHLEFSEKLEAKFSGVDLMKADGSIAPVDVKIAGKTMDATPKGPLSAGGYMVMWHAVAGDGHQSAGDFNFTVK